MKAAPLNILDLRVASIDAPIHPLERTPDAAVAATAFAPLVEEEEDTSRKNWRPRRGGRRPEKSSPVEPTEQQAAQQGEVDGGVVQERTSGVSSASSGKAAPGGGRGDGALPLRSKMVRKVGVGARRPPTRAASGVEVVSSFSNGAKEKKGRKWGGKAGGRTWQFKRHFFEETAAQIGTDGYFADAWQIAQARNQHREHGDYDSSPGEGWVIPLVILVFTLPLASVPLFLVRDRIMSILPLNVPEGSVFAVYLGSCFLIFLFTIFLWTALLFAVAAKFNIKSAVTSPCCWMLKTFPCVCTMSLRVNFHVDRALGFRKPLHHDEMMMELTDYYLSKPEQYQMSMSP